ncbi:MAG: hypothetical protein QXD47_09015 [Candidatus Caldarchaeum sp.]
MGNRLPEGVASQLKRANINQVYRALHKRYGKDAISKRHLYRLKKDTSRRVNSKTIHQLTTYFLNSKEPQDLRSIARMRSKKQRLFELYMKFFGVSPKTHEQTLLKIDELRLQRGWTLRTLARRCEDIAAGRDPERKPPLDIFQYYEEVVTLHPDRRECEIFHLEQREEEGREGEDAEVVEVVKVETVRLEGDTPIVVSTETLPRGRVPALKDLCLPVVKPNNSWEDVLIGRDVPALFELETIAKALGVAVGDIFSPSPQALQAFRKALIASQKDKQLNQALNELRHALGLRW